MRNNGQRTLIIAEAGVNHNGRMDLALKLCDAAKAAGADVIKFQTWITENIITAEVEQAEYQKENTGSQESQFDMLKKLELSYEEFRRIKAYCDEIGIVFSSTGDTPGDLDALVSMGIPFIKIGSGDIGNVPLLRYAGSKQLPVVLSTGMCTLADVEVSLNALRDGGATDITLLHCTTNYPCPYEDVNLKAMDTLQNAFHLPVGYSDHTVGVAVPVAAVARGASVIEKHFTLDRNMDGPDHIASTEPEEFRQMVEAIRNVERALGSALKAPTAAEKEISQVVLKRIVAKRPIPCGKILEEDDIAVKRSRTGLPANAWDWVIGTRARKDYCRDEGVEF